MRPGVSPCNARCHRLAIGECHACLTLYAHCVVFGTFRRGGIGYDAMCLVPCLPRVLHGVSSCVFCACFAFVPRAPSSCLVTSRLALYPVGACRQSSSMGVTPRLHGGVVCPFGMVVPIAPPRVHQRVASPHRVVVPIRPSATACLSPFPYRRRAVGGTMRLDVLWVSVAWFVRWRMRRLRRQRAGRCRRLWDVWRPR